MNCVCIFGDHSTDYVAIAKQIEGVVSSTNSQPLHRLVLSHARLPAIPTINENHNTSLTHLTLSFNKLSSLTSLSALRYLKHLDVSHNRLASLEGIPTTLQSLRCNNNEIESLKSICFLPQLSELSVSNNKIGWIEFVHIIGLQKLESMIKYGNPADEKAKLLDFLISISPSMRSCDGVVCERDEQSDTFLLSTDGRQMLNQVRPQLSVEQKKSLAILRDTASSGSSSSIVGNSNTGTSHGHGHGHHNAEATTTKVVSMRTLSSNIREGTNKGSKSTSSSDDIQDKTNHHATSTDDLAHAITPRIERQTQVTPMPTMNSDGSGPTSGQKDAANNNNNNRSVKVKHSPFPKKFISESLNAGDFSNVHGLETATIIRFGAGDDSAVALCIYVDGSGYAR